MATYRNSELRTPNWQRIVIWIIAIAMLAGTIVGSIFMIIATQNKAVDPNTIAQNKAMEEYQKQLEEYQKQAAEQKKLYRALDGYADKIAAFDAASVSELKVETLKEGDGATVGENSMISANYTGWTPDGTIFESTKLDGSDATPATFAINGVIEGWTKGLTGKRAGGVYELTIPAAQAYGANGSSDGSIPADTPLKFIVQIVDVTNSQAT
jgi:FKBP-type peptidyl-prolyl cis-trans isomerase